MAKTATFVNGTGMWVESFNTSKYQHQYGSSGDLYYTKTLIKFKKTSSSAPIFVYFTVHFDDNGGDMNTYPKEFKNQVYIVACGVVGLTDLIDPEVYDAHEAFEIDKTEMKMLVPLDMNGKQLMNTSFDLKFGDLFIYERCYVKGVPVSPGLHAYLTKKSNNQILSISKTVILISIILKNHNFSYNYRNPFIIIKGFGKFLLDIKTVRFKSDKELMNLYLTLDRGFRHIEFNNTGTTQFDVDILLANA